MKRRYGDALRKDAGMTKVINKVAAKHSIWLESGAGKHASEGGRVVTEVKGSFDKVFKETEEVVEDFLNKCELRSTILKE